jgi:hypothetical protein
MECGDVGEFWVTVPLLFFANGWCHQSARRRYRAGSKRRRIRVVMQRGLRQRKLARGQQPSAVRALRIGRIDFVHFPSSNFKFEHVGKAHGRQPRFHRRRRPDELGAVAARLRQQASRPRNNAVMVRSGRPPETTTPQHHCRFANKPSSTRYNGYRA